MITNLPTARARGLASGAVLGLLLLAGCASAATGSASGTASAGGPSGKITVLAAASLTEPFTTMAKDFEADHPGTTITLSFGASSALATQIIQGAPADVFASASPRNMDAVTQAGAAQQPIPFAKNHLEIVVPAGNPAQITSLADLAKPDVKVAVCQPQVPCGALTQQVFDKADLTVKPVTEEADVKATLTKVSLGEVDAGVVYATDVRAAGTTVRGIEIPAQMNATTSYPIAVLTRAGNPTLATEFINYVRSAPGQATLTNNGFSTP